MNICNHLCLPQGIKDAMGRTNVFFSEEYADYLKSHGQKLIFAYDEERIIPIRIITKLIFKWGVMQSEPYMLTEYPQKSLEKYLDEVQAALGKRCGIQWIISAATAFFDDTPSKNCKRIPFGSHVIDLSCDEEYLWSKVHSKHRNVIRKSEKEEVTIKFGHIELLEDYLKIDAVTWERSGRSGNGHDYYARQINNMKDELEVCMAYHQGIPQAGAIIYYNSQMAYYMYGASADSPMTGAANLLQWEIIKRLKSKNVQSYSFVGCRINEDENSKYHGIQRFKERFGGTLMQGYIFRAENKPLMYKLFCLAMRYYTKSKTPYADVVDQEIHKWQDIQK